MTSMKLLLIKILILSSIYCKKNCGNVKKDSNIRIYKGLEAILNSAPWHIFLLITFPEKHPNKDSKHSGGGVLISEKHILSAAHLFYKDAHKRKPFSAIAYAGIYDWNKDQSQSQQVAFTEADVTLYPDNQNPAYDETLEENMKYDDNEEYKITFFDYDIALIKIGTPFNSKFGVCPICLPTPKILSTLAKSNEDITIFGIGERKKNDNSYKLRYAKMKQINGRQCYKKWFPRKTLPKDFSSIEDRGFCVRGQNKETICNGDSGSPAIWKYKNKEYLIGILSAAQVDCEKQWMISRKKLPKKSVKPSKVIAVREKIIEWIALKGGKEVRTMMRNC